MRKLFISFLFLQSVLFAGGDWLRSNSPTSLNLTQITFKDSLYGWVSGDSGAFYRTSNGGISWTKLNLGTNQNIIDHHFIDYNTGFAVSNEMDTVLFNWKTTFYKTTNAGDTWSSSTIAGEDISINKIHFFDELNGVAGDVRGQLFYTDSSGDRWFPAEFDSTSQRGYAILNLKFFNKNLGFAMGGMNDIAGIIYKTTDGGKKWSGRIIGPAPVHEMTFADSNSILAFSGEFDFGASILTSSNSGLSWEVDSAFNIWGVPQSFSRRTGKEAWVTLGPAGVLIYTEDDMNTWYSIYSPDTTYIHEIVFTDTMHGFACGANGSIFKFKYKEPVSVNDFPPVNRTSFRIEAFPNPFNPSTTIQYVVPEMDLVTIRLYDILGRDAGLIFHGEQHPGTYRRTISASNLSAGIYVCTITIGREASFIKLLYLK